MRNKLDITNQRFGKLIALHPTEQRKKSYVVWECQCDCGNTVFAAATDLVNGNRKSCGCLTRLDISGQKFGRLTAIRPTEERRRGQVIWECKCDCGNTAYATTADLNAGVKKSCGCIKKEISSDISGLRVGRLTVLRPTGEKKNRAILWECRCDCGNITKVVRSNLTNGVTLSCGCLQRERAAESAAKLKAKDITGQKFGRLTAIHPTQDRLGSGIIWECQCDCGNTTYVVTNSLISGHTQSCGCLQKERAAEKHIKDLSGQRFGKLIALRPSKERKYTYVLWECQCDCGNTTLVKSNELIAGKVKSCGCLRVEAADRLYDSVDHVDGTIINMLKQKKLRTCNRTGVTGVTITKDNKFQAHIGFQNKGYYLGRYDKLEDAVAVRRKAEALLHDETVDYYERWKAMAEKDPAWARENPIKITVKRVDETNFDVFYEPNI